MKKKFFALALALMAVVAGAPSVFGQPQPVTFSTVNVPTGSGPTTVIPIDVYGVGLPGLVCANYSFEFRNNPFGSGGGSGTTLSIYTNGGLGALYLKDTVTVGLEPFALVAADVNGDSFPDIVCATVGDNSLTILTNDGNGGFELSAKVATGGGPDAVVAADVNGDGHVDLVTANYADGTLTVLTNNGHGTFARSAAVTVGPGPSSLAAADFNGDGVVDLVCDNGNNGTLTILTNNGKGVFTTAGTVTVSGGAGSVVAEDVNDDGRIDLVAVGGNLNVFTNDGRGNFALKWSGNTGFASGSVVAADFNGDGKIDVACPDNGNGIQGYMTVLTNDGTGNFAIDVTTAVGQGNAVNYPNFITAADFNLDGNNDVAVSCYGTETLSVMTQVGQQGRPTVEILSPSQGEAYKTNATIAIGTLAFGTNTISTLDYYLDGTLVASRTAAPYLLELPAKTLSGGSHALQAKAVDSAGIVGWSKEVQLNIVGAATSVVTPPPTGTEPATDGLILWLDSSDVATVQTNTLGQALAWFNKAPGAYNGMIYSGLNDNNSQPSLNADAPMYVAGSNGIKVLSFDGHGYLDNLDFSSETPSDLTVFVLASVTSNPGNYPAFLAFNEGPDFVDYLTGFNFDLGSGASTPITRLNVEGAKAGGGGGFQFLNGSLNFDQFYLYEIDYGGGSSNNDSLVSVFVNNTPELSRSESSTPVNMEQVFVGSRHGDLGATGYGLDGQIAAVLVYDHQLTGSDLTQTRNYLTSFFSQTQTAVGPPPTVTITSPTNAEAFTTNASFTIRATAKAAKGKTLSAVGFYLDSGTLLGTATSAPYTLTVAASGLAPGGHTIEAVAVDSDGGRASATIQITINLPGTSLINFDALNTTAGAVGGTPLAQYLAGYGVTLTNVSIGTTMEAESEANLTGSVQVAPSSPPNFFTQAGLNTPVSFTLKFAKTVHAVSFTRAGLSSASGLVSHPAWTATALDTNGNEISSVSEALILSTAPVAAKSFELTGNGIGAVRFDSDSQKTAAFSAVLLDDLFLNANPVASLLSVGVTVSAPPAGGFVAPANITITANVTNTLNSSFFVEFYAGLDPLGRATSAPYQFTWTNVLPGTYALRARVVSSSGLAVRSQTVSTTVAPEPDSKVITFDTINTSRSAAKGLPVRNYLTDFGITVTNVTAGTALTVDEATRIAGGKSVSAPTAPNIFTQTGSNGPMHFRLDFSTYLARFGFIRPELLANPFVSHPAWQVTALDGAGTVIDRVSEEEIDSSTNVGKATFSLAAGDGPGIAAVVVESDGTESTTFQGLIMDNWILTASESNFPPAVAITRPVNGRVLAAPPSVEITANAADQEGIQSVAFYANETEIGVATAAPYTIHWRKPPVGEWELSAVATSLNGLTRSSAPVELSIQQSAGLLGIATQPASQTVSAGDLPTFMVQATGTNAVTYQWLFDGAPIAGANAATFTLGHPAEDSDAGNYSVVVSAGGISVTSEAAVLTVVDPPKFATQPAGQTVAPGTDVTLNPVAAGTGPFLWQWLLNGADIPGATNRTYFIQAAQALQSGNYQVSVGNAVASTLSAVAPVVVQAATVPFTNDEFANRAVFNPLLGPVTESNTLATAEPGEPLHDGLPGGKSIWFTWRPNFTGTVSLTTEGSDFDTLLAVYTGTTLKKLKPVAADDDSGGYFTSLVTFNVTAGTPYQIAVDGYQGASGRVVLGFPGGTGYRALNPSSGDSVPVIVRQPVGRVAAPGARVGLSVAAASATKMSYQWSFEGTPIPGATGSSFTIAHLTAAAVGTYDVLVVNTAGSAQSEPAEVEMAVNQNVPAASTQTKFVDGGSAAPAAIAYEIRPRAGGDTRGFSVSQVFSTVGATTEAGEPNPCGQVISAAKWFTYSAPGAGQLQISSDGSDFNTVLGIYTGSGASFAELSEVACGYTTNYLTNGQPSVTLDVPAAGTRYFILVGGYNGANGTAELQIGSGQAPVFNRLPASQLITAGTTTTLKAVASGSLPLAYQWQLNGTDIPGADRANFTIANAQEDDEGNYTVVVSNSVAVITSAPPSALTLQYAPAVVAGPSNETVVLGQTARFTVKTAGVNVRTNAFAYQWYFEGAPIARATAATLAFRAEWTNQGYYYLVIANSYGAATSEVATLTVVDKTPPTVMIRTPGNNFVTASDSVTLTGTATDAAGILLVQAQLNGGAFTEATGTTNWSVVVSNLPGGQNVIGVESIDLSSNVSILAKRVVIHNPVALGRAKTYSGLFYPASNVSRTNAGFLTATVASGGGGVFSGNLLLAGKSHAFSGLFGPEGAAEVSVNEGGETLALGLKLDSTEEVLTGSVSSAGWVSALRAEAEAAGGVQAGGTFELVGTDGAVGQVGSLAVRENALGMGIAQGTLMDGAKILRSGGWSTMLALPLYAPLYSGQGIFLGWVNLTNASTGYWIKPGATEAIKVSIVR